MSERRDAGTQAGSVAGGGPRERPGVGRWVAAQSAVGVVAAGVASANPVGWTLAGAGALALVPLLTRRDRRALHEPLTRRLRRGPVVAGVSAVGGTEGAEREGLGLVHRLLPALDVVAVPDRNGTELGMVADGRGSAALLELPGGALPSLPVGLLAAWLREDPARPTGAQLLVEQFGLPPWDLLYRYRPTVAYRQLPAQGVPAAVRSWLVVRHEPLEAPDSVARRGGGVRGAGSALAAATARLRARLASAGVPSEVLGPEQVRAALRQSGDATGGGGPLPGRWAGEAATHCAVTAEVGAQADWARLLDGLGRASADRILTGATVELRDGVPMVRTVVRLVGAVGEQVVAERDRLAAAALVGPPAADQAAGVLATLPLAAPSRSSAAAAGWALTGRR
ncbi:type VII secretion protein EccE [Streptomyces spiramenti]|uniref:Type VII secretion system protein EccE domain-containing protein n=1 Tax=Streptomyces spiramenti TaxID=2720606 RepID=A0ABX1AHR3_9ACTN|nr:type VII secretion protein EccE [Streptomyces spiramenti]NJP65740.1 hypothetical protein [Streptomyces spiramenti]